MYTTLLQVQSPSCHQQEGVVKTTSGYYPVSLNEPTPGPHDERKAGDEALPGSQKHQEVTTPRSIVLDPYSVMIITSITHLNQP